MRLCIVFMCIGWIGCHIGAATPVAKYEVASWPESGFGNHRAVIEVPLEAANNSAVKVSIPWRRRDPQPEQKALLLFHESGTPITDILPLYFSADHAELAFRPEGGAGKYYLYFMPYRRAGMFESEEYLTARDSALPAWSSAVRAAPEALPSASLLSLQARNQFNRFDPMEVPATAEEAASLAARYPGAPFLIFPEDREHDIRMTDRIPVRWLESGASEHFSGTARPGEYYVFQLGIWNPGNLPVKELQPSFAELRTGNGEAIPADALTCFNTAGVDMHGNPFKRALTVQPQAVQPLWIGVNIPPEADGTYRGTLTLSAADAPPCEVAVTLGVSGPPLADGGVSELDRLSRLKWLNSTRGSEDTMIPEFEPIRYENGVIDLRNRSIRLGKNGLPDSIVSNGRELLAAPMRLGIQSQGLSGSALPAAVQPVENFTVNLTHRAQLDSVSAVVESRAEADGCIQFTVRLTAEQPTAWDNLTLELPLRREVAKYWMGMEKRGGLRQSVLDWHWNGKYLNNLIWAGDFDAGVQLKLQSEADPWALWATPTDPDMLWDASGAGGCRSIESEDSVTLQAYTGAMTLEAGVERVLRFRLLVTPFKPISPRHWQVRIQDAVQSPDNTVFHLHHGSIYMPYINYPFTNMPDLTAFIDSLRQPTLIATDAGTVTADLQKYWNRAAGALHFEVTVNFDSRERVPGSNDSNQPFAVLEFGAANGRLILYWNTDDSGMRTLIQRGDRQSADYPIQLPGAPADYIPGARHVITLSWGKSLELFIDGKSTGRVSLNGLPEFTEASLQLAGSGFTIGAVRLDEQEFAGGALPDLLHGTGSVWFQRFARLADLNGSDVKTTGEIEFTPAGLRCSSRQQVRAPREAQVYYTVRELSNHCRELWAFRSLGDEIFTTSEGLTYTEMGAFTFGSGNGYPWLQEHLLSGYVPAWRTTWLDEIGMTGDFCAAITTKSNSRLLNYYIEGIHWLFQQTGLQGLYLDGIGYNRDIMKRVARTLATLRADYRISAHCSDLYEMDKISVMNHNMEHLPYVTDLWLGEAYQYSKSPDYYLIEISGIPFGVTNEMLNYENGGNPWRGMIFGMSGRFLPDVAAMWRFWDHFGIDEAEMLGYWNPACPVATDQPSIKATCYRKGDQALIALAHWSPEIGSEARHAVIPALDSAKQLPDQGAVLTRFVNYTDCSLMAPEQQTILRTAVLPEGLMIDFECLQPETVQARTLPHDKAVWEDDAMEFFIQPDLQQKLYYQFAINAAGSRYDSEKRNPAWNGDWEGQVETTSSGWRGRVSIPWSTLGIPRPEPGTEIGVNIGRDHGKQPSSWSMPDGSFHNTNAFSRWQVGTAPTREEQPSASECVSTIPVRLQIDPAIFPDFAVEEYELLAPEIPSFQSEARFAPSDSIPIEAGKGVLLWLKRK